MCIIAYAPKGVKIQEDTIKFMFMGNPDGAGIMWKPTDNSKVEIRKGFMKVEDLIKAYREIPVECEKAIHCRIATSGKVSKACCHPFPVRAKTSAMKQAKDRTSIALMHNGMINYCEPKEGIKAGYSDTMLFVAKYLYPAQKLIDNDWWQTLVENSTYSRLLIMREFGETIMLGSWQFADGVYYSNGNYKPRMTAKYAKAYDEWWNDHQCPEDDLQWEALTLSVGCTPVMEAESAVKEVLKTSDTVEDYEVYTSRFFDGRLYADVIGLASDIEEIAGFKIIGRRKLMY